MSHTMDVVVEDVKAERLRQVERWGDQRHPDGTGNHVSGAFAATARVIKLQTAAAAAEGLLTWRHILREEVAEAIAEDDQARLRAELVQVAAVAVAWIEDIDRRQP